MVAAVNEKMETPLHEACREGSLEMVKFLVEMDPWVVYKVNREIESSLSGIKGHLEITRELLRPETDLSSLKDANDRKPLHWAAIRGRINVIEEILLVNLEGAQMTTKQGETVHLAEKNNQYEAVKFLTEAIHITDLLNKPDNSGNTILHLAVTGKLINTALDLLESTENSSALSSLFLLLEVDGKHSHVLPLPSPEIQLQEKMPASSMTHHRSQSHHLSQKKLLQDEGVRNAHKTITVVAVLVSTVTLAAGINPPGGSNQVTGEALLGRQTSFKIFVLCNVVAVTPNGSWMIWVLAVVVAMGVGARWQFLWGPCICWLSSGIGNCNGEKQQENRRMKVQVTLKYK
ncbi:hypothetical protein P3X46_026820 [Hevea brasiliensis]|uniref:PGG domain-containing protein n=1 Tax=Hevea brasiliensis TaxID=3981 RepID=A0ABQ9KXV5_HEVBR|nr:hypothetical protein P3X46_026820 [Hevea brasiliensis]